MGARATVRRRLSRIALSALLATGVAPARPAAAVDPASAAVLHLAETLGGSPADFELVHEPDPESGGLVSWAAKFVDRRTGAVHSVYRDAAGAYGDEAVLDEIDADRLAERTVLERKGDPALLAAVADRTRQAADRTLLPVAVWLDADPSNEVGEVQARHPEVTWVAGRPVPDTLDEARSLRAELWEARRSVYVAAAEAIRPEIEAAGGTLAYASTSAPLVFVDLPPGGVERVAGLPSVRSLGLESEWRTSMSSAGPTVSANWTGGSGDQGNGVRVAVVEYHNVSATGDLAGQVVASYSTTGSRPTHIHPTWVAGAIASRNGTYAGVAPGADIVSAGTGGYSPGLSTDRAIIAAADWAVAPGGGDSDVINVSLGQDTATGAEEARRYFDSIGWEDGRLVVAASGNFSTFGNWDVVSPGTGYNVLTVGGLNDRGTGGRGDDILWYVPGSDGANYRDRTDASWNPHGDFNKPNLSAPAVSVRTANGIYGDGTSVASPIVAGIAAQLMARAPVLASWPEASRAILMAGAIARTPLPGGGASFDHEGVGSASALWSNRILTQSNGAWGGFGIGAMRAGQTVVREVPVVAGQRVRVVVAWSSHTSGTSNTGKADRLMADLDLRVVSANGTVTGAYRWDNPYETVDIVAPATGVMRLEIVHDRFEAAEEPYALAWALTSPYSDTGSSPFYADILWAAQQGITLGCGSGKFCPGAGVTREQMASFLARALDLPSSATDYFTDDESSPHEADINAVAAAGITGGCGGERYCPRSTVTREQMASFLARGLGLPATGTDYFTDDESSPHEADINAVAAAGITNGCTGSAYCPRATVTREQMTAFLHRALT
jgi:hypothetical protein